MQQKEVYYTSYIQRERHAIVDRAVEQCQEALQIPQVRRALGSRATAFSQTLDAVVVPNMYHGQVQPHLYADTRLAVIPVHPGEKVWSPGSDLDFNARQREVMYSQYSIDEAEQIISHAETIAVTAEYDYLLPSPSEVEQAAYVVHDHFKWMRSDGKDTVFRTRPSLVLDASRPSYRSVPVMFHELTHVYQMNEQPAVVGRASELHQAIEQEFEAFHVEADLLEAYKQAGRHEELIAAVGDDDIIKTALLYDAIRRDHVRGGMSPYFVTDAVIADLQRAGLL